MKRPLVFILVSFLQAAAIAQTGEDEIKMENLQESLQSAKVDADERDEEFNLNTISEPELLSIPSMTRQFARAIISYRVSNGPIRSFDELRALEGSTPDLISMLRQHAKIALYNGPTTELSTYAAFSPEKIAIYRDADGESGFRNFQKFRVEYGNIEAYSVTDKDAGERDYLDFFSASVLVRNVLCFSAFDVGDYTLSLGNGMLFSKPGMATKSFEPVSPLFEGEPFSLKPYWSRAENGFLRGAAVEMPSGDFDFTCFVSRKSLSASFDTSGRVSSIDYTGLSTVTSGNGTERKLGESVYGGIAGFNSGLTYCGMAAAYFDYDHPFQDYYRERNLDLEMYLRSRFDNAEISGEVVSARTTSFTANLDLDYQDAEFCVGLRNLRMEIAPVYAGVISETHPLSPEEGIYLGTTLRPVKHVNIGFYYDRFRLISLSGKPDRNGEEILAESYINLSERDLLDGGTLYFRYRYKSKEDYYLIVDDLPAAQSTMEGSNQSVRIEIADRFSASYSAKLRFDKIFVSSGESGEMLLLAIDFSSAPLRMTSAISVYRTDSYLSGIYVSEKDLPGVSQLVVLYGDGARMSLLALYSVSRAVSVSCKLSRDVFNAKREVSLGKISNFFPALTYVGFELSFRFR